MELSVRLLLHLLDLDCTLDNISVLIFITVMLTVVLHIFIAQLRTKNECSVLFG